MFCLNSIVSICLFGFTTEKHEKALRFKRKKCWEICILYFRPSSGKAFVPKKAPEIPVHEQVILEPELEEALKNATDAEMCDIAG